MIQSIKDWSKSIAEVLIMGILLIVSTSLILSVFFTESVVR